MRLLRGKPLREGAPMLQSRYTVFILCLVMTAIGLLLIPHWDGGKILAVVFASLSLIGVIDLVQTRHSIQRNYPVIGHIRWMVEFVRPEIRQYLIEADEEASPFSRSQRSLVYQRAKGLAGEHPFGTLLDVYRPGYEFIAHSTRPVDAADPA